MNKTLSPIELNFISLEQSTSALPPVFLVSSFDTAALILVLTNVGPFLRLHPTPFSHDHDFLCLPLFFAWQTTPTFPPTPPLYSQLFLLFFLPFWWHSTSPSPYFLSLQQPGKFKKTRLLFYFNSLVSKLSHSPPSRVRICRLVRVSIKAANESTTKRPSRYSRCRSGQFPFPNRPSPTAGNQNLYPTQNNNSNSFLCVVVVVVVDDVLCSFEQTSGTMVMPAFLSLNRRMQWVKLWNNQLLIAQLLYNALVCCFCLLQGSSVVSSFDELV